MYQSIRRGAWGLVALLLTASVLHGATITVDTTTAGNRIPRELWGNNTPWHPFESFYQNGNALPSHLEEAIKQMGVPSLRYPGGCWSDTFTWETAIGPKGARSNQWLNGCSAPAYEHHPAYFGVDEFLQLCEKLAAEPQITLQYRSRDVDVRHQIETNYTVVNDAPPAGIFAGDFNHDDGQHVSFQDVGDAIKITFAIPRDGYYRLHLRARSGHKDDDDAYWTSNGYGYALDGNGLTLTGDTGTFSPVDADGWTVWGTARSDVIYLRYGNHELTLTAQTAWLKADYLEVEELNHDNSVKRAQAWVAYCNGHPADTRSIGVDEAGVDWHTVGHWATRRGQSDYGDHPEPYGVKFWEVGNEAWGVDPYGSPPNFDGQAYADSWADYHAAISTIDPGLRLSLCSNTPDSQGVDETDWPAVVIGQHGDVARYLHYHPYYPWNRWDSTPLALYQQGVTAAVALQASLDMYRNVILDTHPTRLGTLKISASEWAAAYGWSGPNVDWATRWTGAMCVAEELAVYAQNTDLMESAQYWLLYKGVVHVFGSGSGANAPNGYFKQSLYPVFEHFNHYHGDQTLNATVTGSPTFSFDGWGSTPAGNYPYLTAYASRDARGCYLFVVNKDPANSQSATLNWNGLPDATNRVTIRTIEASSTLPNYADRNTAAEEVIHTTVANKQPFETSFTHAFPPCSLTFFVIEQAKPQDRTWYREAEDIHTVYKDASPAGNVTIQSPWNHDSAGHVSMINAGDAILIPFNVVEAGYYTIRVRLRTGSGADPDSYVTGNGYAYAINGSPASFAAVPGSYSPVDIDGFTVWGTTQRTGQYLDFGRHYLRITMNSTYGKVDWIELEQEKVHNVEAESSYTIVQNSSGQINTSGLNLDSGNHVSFHANDIVRITFNLPRAGNYTLQLRQRTGTASGTTSQFPYYDYTLDGHPLCGSIDMPTVSRLDADGHTYWGTVVFPLNNLSAGTHTLDVELTGSSYGKLDYLTAIESLEPLTPDPCDACPDDPTKLEPGHCGCGTPETPDTDGDGTFDCNDGCPNDPNKTAPGQCGCGALETDTDGDGSADCNDQCPQNPQRTVADACGCGSGADADGDNDVDADDTAIFIGCVTGPALGPPTTCCEPLDFDSDTDVDQADFGTFQRCFRGPGTPPLANCLQ